jgi:hypothetical protein
MKQIILTLFVLTVFVNTNAQTTATIPYDTLVQRVLKLEQSNASIKTGMEKAHSEFRTGTALIFVGVALSGLSVVMASGKDELGTGQGVAIAGLAFATVGTILHFDAHKHLGRAGGWTKKKKA